MTSPTAIERDGIPIEKGVVLTRQYLDDNEALFTKYLNFWILYPDLLLDVIKRADDNGSSYEYIS